MTSPRYRWVIVAAGGLLGCVAIGGMFSLPVFLKPIAQDTGWSVTGVSSAMTIGFLAMAFTSMGWGALSDRFGPFPVVLVNEEIFGVHEYIKDVCRRLAKAGYLAVATEYYARIGDLSKMTDVKQIVSDVISKAPDAQYMSDADSTVAWALQNGGSPSRIGVMGFCRGGRQTWLYAEHNPDLKAAVAFYGPLGGNPSPIQPKTASDLAEELKCPLLGLYGGQDTGIPVDSVRQAEAKAKAAGKTVEIVVYPDAPHGFHADYRPSYRQADAEDAWKRTLAWFHRFGV